MEISLCSELETISDTFGTFCTPTVKIQNSGDLNINYTGSRDITAGILTPEGEMADITPGMLTPKEEGSLKIKA